MNLASENAHSNESQSARPVSRDILEAPFMARSSVAMAFMTPLKHLGIHHRDAEPLEADPKSGFRENMLGRRTFFAQRRLERLLEGLAVPPGAEKGPPERTDLRPMCRGWGFRSGPWACSSEIAYPHQYLSLLSVPSASSASRRFSDLFSVESFRQ